MGATNSPFSLVYNKGFSLVELMIVVAIIGVLAALAVPKFQTFQAKAKQSEAKSNLAQIYTLELSYFGDRDTFGTMADIGFTTQGRVRYGYTMPTNNATSFTAKATATSNTVIASDCGFADVWQITEARALTLVADCVTKNATLNRTY